MFEKKHLRGDPDLPFNNDPAEIESLLKRHVSVTHEPLWFYRSRGTSSPAQEKHWHDCTSIENIEVMERLGMHVPKRVYFFKGIGLERERAQIEKTIEYARRLHERNMLVSVYVGGTMFTDYFFKEVPEAREWRRVDMDGHPVTYGGWQMMRWFPCLNHPEYRAYTKRVLDVAVQEVDADEIFFDNQILRYEPRSCRCGHCIGHFRDLVKRRYSLEECERRYGVAEYPDVEPPYFSQAAKPWRMDEIHCPQTQDWIDHRVWSVIDFYSEMAGHVKSQKPSCVVGMNIKGIHGHNRAFDHGISHGDFAGVLDFSCIDGYRPGRIKGTQTFWSEVRFFKQSHSTNVSVVDGGSADLPSVENTVLNNRKFVEGHGRVGVDPYPFSPVGRFLCANKRLFLDRERCHDIAVLRSQPSTNYNCSKVHEQLFAFEQALIVEKLPWGIIFDGNMGDLSRFRAVALPEIQALSDEWLGALDAFMRAGGAVIASGGAADYDGWYRPRDPDHAFDRWLSHRRSGYEAVDVGEGRFVYVPEWEVHTPWNFDDWFAVYGGNVLPVTDRALFMRAVADAVRGGPALAHRVTGNDFVVVEGIAAAGGRSEGVDLHFINHDPGNLAPVMRVSVGLPEGSSAGAVTIVDPEDEKAGFPERAGPRAGAGGGAGLIEFDMPTPRVYGIARVRFE